MTMTTGGDATNNTTVLVPKTLRDKFDSRLAKLNTKAEGFGLAPITVIGERVVPYINRAVHLDKGIRYNTVPHQEGAPLPADAVGQFDMVELQLLYPIIKLGDWRIVAQRDAADAGSLVYVSSKDSADRAEANRRRRDPMHCEHCELQRDRRQVFLLREGATANYRQVGSTCLLDFTGQDPAGALFLAQLSRFEKDAGELTDDPAGQASTSLRTRAYLAQVMFHAQRHGFVGTGAARDHGGIATYQFALDLPEALQRNPAYADSYRAEEPRLHSEVASMIAWYEQKVEAAGETASEFDRNALVLLQGDTIRAEPRQLATAAAAVRSYMRDQLAKRKALREAGSRFVGEPKQRLTRAVRVYEVERFDTDFGPKCVISLIDDDGNCFSWKTDSFTAPEELTSDAKREHPLLAAFTVVSHPESSGRQVTQINRLKLKEWLPADGNDSGQS